MNPYEVLGVEPTATEEEISRAYRAKAMEHHPDRGGDPDKMKGVNAAYELLSDPVRRAAYDKEAATPPLTEAMRNLLSMFTVFIGNYEPGTDIVQKMRAVVANNMREFRAGLQHNAAASKALLDLKERIVFRGFGPNLFAEAVQGQIERLQGSRKHLEEAIATWLEMESILAGYFFKTPRGSVVFPVWQLGGYDGQSRRLLNILESLEG